MRPYAAKCGAKAKSTGEPCKRLAMANGRCCLHGGRTPKGDNWHKTRWPNKNSPIEKLHQKEEDLDRARAQRKQMLRDMNPERRAAYEKWHKERPAGSAARRREVRLRREQAAAMRKTLAAPPPRPSNPEMEAIDKVIAQLEADALALRRGSIFD